MQRGLLSTNRGTPNKGYVEKTKKFDPPKSDVLNEQFLEKIQPRDAVKSKQLRTWIQNRKEAIARAAKRTLSQATTDQKRIIEMELQASLNAWNMWETQVEHNALNDQADAEFSKGFFAWLQGKGSEDDHQKTPWFRHRVNDAEVRHYVNSFAEAKIDFIQSLQRLVMKAQLGGLEGINEFYMYYKYIVRGGWEDRSSAEFLYDWNKYLGWDTNQPETTKSIIKDTPTSMRRFVKQWYTRNQTNTVRLANRVKLQGWVAMHNDYADFWRSARTVVDSMDTDLDKPYRDKFKSFLRIFRPSADGPLFSTTTSTTTSSTNPQPTPNTPPVQLNDVRSAPGPTDDDDAGELQNIAEIVSAMATMVGDRLDDIEQKINDSRPMAAVQEMTDPDFARTIEFFLNPETPQTMRDAFMRAFISAISTGDAATAQQFNKALQQAFRIQGLAAVSNPEDQKKITQLQSEVSSLRASSEKAKLDYEKLMRNMQDSHNTNLAVMKQNLELLTQNTKATEAKLQKAEAEIRQKADEVLKERTEKLDALNKLQMNGNQVIAEYQTELGRSKLEAQALKEELQRLGGTSKEAEERLKTDLALKQSEAETLQRRLENMQNRELQAKETMTRLQHEYAELKKTSESDSRKFAEEVDRMRLLQQQQAQELLQTRSTEIEAVQQQVFAAIDANLQHLSGMILGEAYDEGSARQAMEMFQNNEKLMRLMNTYSSTQQALKSQTAALAAKTQDFDVGLANFNKLRETLGSTQEELKQEKEFKEQFKMRFLQEEQAKNELERKVMEMQLTQANMQSAGEDLEKRLASFDKMKEKLGQTEQKLEQEKEFKEQFKMRFLQEEQAKNELERKMMEMQQIQTTMLSTGSGLEQQLAVLRGELDKAQQKVTDTQRELQTMRDNFDAQKHLLLQDNNKLKADLDNEVSKIQNMAQQNQLLQKLQQELDHLRNINNGLLENKRATDDLIEELLGSSGKQEIGETIGQLDIDKLEELHDLAQRYEQYLQHCSVQGYLQPHYEYNPDQIKHLMQWEKKMVTVQTFFNGQADRVNQYAREQVYFDKDEQALVTKLWTSQGLNWRTELRRLYVKMHNQLDIPITPDLRQSWDMINEQITHCVSSWISYVNGPGAAIVKKNQKASRPGIEDDLELEMGPGGYGLDELPDPLQELPDPLQELSDPLQELPGDPPKRGKKKEKIHMIDKITSNTHEHLTRYGVDKKKKFIREVMEDVFGNADNSYVKSLDKDVQYDWAVWNRVMMENKTHPDQKNWKPGAGFALAEEQFYRHKNRTRLRDKKWK